MACCQEVSLVLVLVSLVFGFASGQCPEVEFSDLGTVNTSTVGLISDALTIGQGSNPNVELHSFNTVCLAISGVRDEYQFTSIVANYTCSQSGHQICNEAIPRISQFHFQCSDVGGTPTWVTNIFGTTSFTVTDPADADLDTPLRTDCAFCASPSQLQGVENITHCLPCSSECTNLQMCTNVNAEDCCNFFQNDTCVVQCNSGFVSNQNNDCEPDPCNPSPCDPNAVCMQDDEIGVDFNCTCIIPFVGNGLVCQNPGSTVGGDPHFSVVLPGSGDMLCYSIQGEQNKIFNLISNKWLYMNAHFVPDKRRPEVTWLGTIGIVALNYNRDPDAAVRLVFHGLNKTILVEHGSGERSTINAVDVAEMIFEKGRLSIHGKEKNIQKFRRNKKHAKANVHLELIDIGLAFNVRFVKNRLDLFWYNTSNNSVITLHKSHGLIGQFLNSFTELDKARRILIMPNKEPVPVMQRPVWSFMEREETNDQLCWVAMNPGYQGKRLIDGSYMDYAVESILSTEFKPPI